MVFIINNWIKQQIQTYLQQHPRHTINEAFEYFSNGDRTNTHVLVPNKQQFINNPATADINNIISEIKAVLSELHNKTDKVPVTTKQILLSA